MTEAVKPLGLVLVDELDTKLAFENKPADIVRVDLGDLVSSAKAADLKSLVEARLGVEAGKKIEGGVAELAVGMVKELSEKWPFLTEETRGLVFNPSKPSKSVEDLVKMSENDPVLKKILDRLIALANGWERGMKDKATKAKLKTEDDYSAVKVMVPVMRVVQGNLSIEGLGWYLKRTASFHYLRSRGGVKPVEGTNWSPKPLSLSQLDEILKVFGAEVE